MKEIRNCILYLLVMAYCVACSNNSVEKIEQLAPEAELPDITSISNDLTTSINKSVILSVDAEVSDSGTITYQWFSATEDKLKAGTALSDALEKEYSPDVSEIGTFYYYCEITNTLEKSSKTTVSPRITVIVKPSISAGKPIIVLEPKNISGEIDTDFSFEVNAYSPDNGTLSYQWYYSNGLDNDGTAIINATERIFDGKISKTLLGYYYCIITNKIEDNGDEGKKTSVIQTNKVILSNNVVNANYPQIIAQPDNEECIVPEHRKFSVKAVSPDKELLEGTLTYQWYSIDDNNESNLIIGATDSTYEATAKKVGTMEYYCVVTNSITDNGDGGIKTQSAISEKANLVVKVVDAQSPVINVQPEDMTVIVPATATLTVGASVSDGGILTYQWYSVDDENESEIIDGAIESTYEITSAQSETTEYYCIITNTIADNGDGGKKSASIETAKTLYHAFEFEIPVFESPLKEYNLNSITCDAMVSNNILPIYYRWFKTENSYDSAIPATSKWSTSSELTLTDKGIGKYFCAAMIFVPQDDTDISKLAAFSDIVYVANTGLPTIIIDTENSENPTSAKEKHNGRMLLIKDGNTIYDSGKKNELTIKVRGNATAYFPKKPYKLKLPKKANLLSDNPLSASSNKDKNWILLAGYTDKTLLRSKIGFYVSSLFNEIDGNEQLYVPHSEFVDVILNGEYLGNYCLTDSVKEGKDRIPVNENNNDEGGIGFIAEWDYNYYKSEPKFFISHKEKPYTFKFPETDDNSFDSYMAYFEEYINQFEKELYNSESNKWSEYIDLESFARWYLITNILANMDGNYYFTKKTSDSTSKLVMEPTWDFEWSIGIGWYDGTRPRESVGYYCYKGNNPNDPDQSYFVELLKKTAFKEELKKQYEKLRDIYPALANTINNEMDVLAQEIDISQEINFMKWDILNKRISHGGIPLGTYEEELKCDKHFMEERIKWLNSYIDSL